MYEIAKLVFLNSFTSHLIFFVTNEFVIDSLKRFVDINAAAVYILCGVIAATFGMLCDYVCGYLAAKYILPRLSNKAVNRNQQVLWDFFDKYWWLAGFAALFPFVSKWFAFSAGIAKCNAKKMLFIFIITKLCVAIYLFVNIA